MEPDNTHHKPGGCFQQPETVEEALQLASLLAIPEEFTRAIFYQLDGRGWRDGANIEIRKFTSHLIFRWTKERGTWKPDGSKTEGVWAMKERLKVIDDQIEQMTNEESLSYESYRVDGKLSLHSKDVLKRLRAKKKEILDAIMGI